MLFVVMSWLCNTFEQPIAIRQSRKLNSKKNYNIFCAVHRVRNVLISDRNWHRAIDDGSLNVSIHFFYDKNKLFWFFFCILHKLWNATLVDNDSFMNNGKLLEYYYWSQNYVKLRLVTLYLQRTFRLLKLAIYLIVDWDLGTF